MTPIPPETSPTIALLAGGVSAEREVSLGSGRACALALSRSFPTRLVPVNTQELPHGLDPARDIVFSTLHGTFGEDGGMQRLMEASGIVYAGCDSEASALTMDKTRTKTTVGAAGVPSAPGILFSAGAPPSVDEALAQLGSDLILKPNNEGSSVGLQLIDGGPSLESALAQVPPGRWLLEKRIRGRELSIGILGGKALGVVEIRPRSGVYDYTSKYTKGMTEYLAPAPLDDAQTRRMQSLAEAAFAACGCRDYARVDFIFSQDGGPFFLEINTLPGMKETSLLPMSARCAGWDFISLLREMVRPAVARFRGPSE